MGSTSCLVAPCLWDSFREQDTDLAQGPIWRVGTQALSLQLLVRGNNGPGLGVGRPVRGWGTQFLSVVSLRGDVAHELYSRGAVCDMGHGPTFEVTAGDGDRGRTGPRRARGHPTCWRGGKHLLLRVWGLTWPVRGGCGQRSHGQVLSCRRGVRG
jgi:hypothetical protein